MKSIISVGLSLAVVLALFSSFTTAATLAPVDVYAGDFTNILGHPLAGYQVLHEESGKIHTTDSKGYLHLQMEVGTNVTFTLLAGKGFTETQSGTVTVPSQGLAGVMNEVVLQVPSTTMFDMLNLILPHKRNFSQCQIVVTVCNYQKTFTNCPQGYPGVKTMLHPPLEEYTYYFGTWGKFSNETCPLPNKLTSTSWDGGVFLMNVDMHSGVRDFEVTAHYGSVPFTKTYARCIKPGRLVNAAPNQGPRALAPINAEVEPPVPPRHLLGKCGWHW